MKSYQYSKNSFILYFNNNSINSQDFEDLKIKFPDMEAKRFDTQDDLFDFVKGEDFKNIYIILTIKMLKSFIQKFSREMKDIAVIPKFIIYLTKYPYKLPYYNNPYYDYFTYKTVISDNNLINLIQSEETHQYFNDISSNQSIPLTNKKLEEDKFYFEIIDKKEKLILPVYFRTMIKIDSSIKTDKFTKYLYKKYQNNHKIKSLLSQIIKLKNIPIELLSKYWVRVYTAQDFHYHINDHLKNGTKESYEKYKIFIQMMYEGLNLKSLKEPKENIDLYRGCKLSNYEFNNLKKFLNKKNDDFPKAIVYSRTFSSFSKSKEIALKFLYDDKFFDKKKMKKVLIVLKADKYDNKYLNSFADIEKLSFFENEKEVLAFPFSCFEITEIKSYPDYEQIEFNYLSKYDAKLKKFFKNSNIKKNKKLIDSEFKKFITNSDIIKKDILIKSSVSSIISNSKKYIEKQKNIENNKENKKIQINNEYINENSLNSLSTITSKNSNVPIKHEDNNNKCKNNCFDYVCDYFKNLSNLYK